MTIHATFYSLRGKFSITKREEFDSTEAGMLAVQAYAEPLGFSNFKLVEDGDSYRVTATTPNGRTGRNIATFDSLETW